MESVSKKDEQIGIIKGPSGQKLQFALVHAEFCFRFPLLLSHTRETAKLVCCLIGYEFCYRSSISEAHFRSLVSHLLKGHESTPYRETGAYCTPSHIVSKTRFELKLFTDTAPIPISLMKSLTFNRKFQVKVGGSLSRPVEYEGRLSFAPMNLKIRHLLPDDGYTVWELSPSDWKCTKLLSLFLKIGFPTNNFVFGNFLTDFGGQFKILGEETAMGTGDPWLSPMIDLALGPASKEPSTSQNILRLFKRQT